MGDPLRARARCYPRAAPGTTTSHAAIRARLLAFRESGLTQEGLAQRLGTEQPVVHRMLDPRHGTTASDLNRALRALGRELVVEVRELAIS